MFGTGVHGLHGEGELRAEAVPPHDDEHLGRRRSSPSPSDRTSFRHGPCWPRTPDSPGSLGIAISEAVEDAATHADTNYALGSVLNHVLLHQTVIGHESKKQMALAGEDPDVVIGCFGGGSNFGGIALPYVLDKLEGLAGAHHGGRTGGLPHPHQGRLRLRLTATPRSSRR